MEVRICRLDSEEGSEDGKKKLRLLSILLSGRTIPVSYTQWALTDPPQSVTADFFIGPEPGGYEVRYECRLAVERAEQARAAAREPQPYCLEERLTYLDQRTGRRRKAFDTVGLTHYQGVHPRDVMHVLARNRWEFAQICAIRLLAERLGRSFLFLEDFRLLAQRTRRLRPGAYFLNALRAFASENDLLRIAPCDRSENSTDAC